MTPAEELAKQPHLKSKDVSFPFDATNLIKCRKKLELDQHLVANALEISQPYYCNIEKGSSMSLLLAFKISTFFGIPIETLWKLK